LPKRFVQYIFEGIGYPFKRITRSIEYFIQRMVRGFDDSDTWNLHATVEEFILPRLKRFREITAKHPFGGYPMGLASHEEWLSRLDDMIYSLEVDSFDAIYGNKVDERFKRGRGYLMAHWGNLWW